MACEVNTISFWGAASPLVISIEKWVIPGAFSSYDQSYKGVIYAQKIVGAWPLGGAGNQILRGQPDSRGNPPK